MDSNRFISTQLLTTVLLIVIIAASGAVMYAVNEIDKVVNDQLYDYGLQFNNSWGDPYHGFTFIVYIGLGAIIIVSLVILLLGYIKPKKQAETTYKPTQPVIQTPVYTAPKAQETPAPVPTVSRTKSTAATEEKKPKSGKKQNETPNTNISGVCPGCKKTYTQSLVMLDFEDGKSKLVNVCPYCNHVLGDTEQKQ